MITIGTCFYPARGDTERRQQRAREALLELAGVTPVNLQFVDDEYRPAGLPTLAVLRQDARTITGANGRRQPIVSEMFDALADAAAAHGSKYFAYLNADIEVTGAALDRILSRGLDGYAFCRMDVDPATHAELAVQPYGLDFFAIDVAWWRRERTRFRGYIAGEWCWDNVYAAMICSHGRGEIVHDAPGVFHERHETAWNRGLYAEYNGYLAALDAPYFSRWVAYVRALLERRSAGIDVDLATLNQEIFGPPPLTLPGHVWHAGRKMRAHMRFAKVRRRMLSDDVDRAQG
jgi:hypothetical protein